MYKHNTHKPYTHEPPESLYLFTFCISDLTGEGSARARITLGEDGVEKWRVLGERGDI